MIPTPDDGVGLITWWWNSGLLNPLLSLEMHDSDLKVDEDWIDPSPYNLQPESM